MSKSKSLLRGPRKKKPVPRGNSLKEKVFFGTDHPPVKKEMSPIERLDFLSWCAYQVEAKTARSWLEEYLKRTGRSAKNVPDQWIARSVCHRCKLYALGVDFTEDQLKFLEEGVEEVLAHGREPTDDEKAGKSFAPSIQERIREKFSDVMGDLEGLLDDGAEFDVEAWIRERRVSPMIASRIVSKLKPRLQELEEVLEGSDPQLVEGYRCWTKARVRAMRDEVLRISMILERNLENQKRARAPRKPRPVSIEKKLRFLVNSYLRHSKDFNVTSVDPARIIGAQELWTLNVKYKLLTVFRAEGHGGQLDVSRRSVSGHNPYDSKTYRLGRKVNDLVDQVLKVSKQSLRRLVSNLKESPLQERIGEHTVLLRVY